MRTHLLIAATAALSACALGEISFAGKQCFAPEDCPSGYVCSESGTCLPEGALIGDPDAGGFVPEDPGASGLPCDLRTFLADNCQSCHGMNPASTGAPMPLLTYQDLTAPAVSDPNVSVAELSIQRMQHATAPMPPSGPRATADQIALLETFVANGFPQETCGEAPADWRLEAPPQCTTNSHWDSDELDKGSERMNPGLACISCHDRERPDEEDVPDLLIGGTLFPTAHEPDLCFGGVAGAKVVITDAMGRVYELTPNASGNFLLHRSSQSPFEFPFTARVVSSDGERKMHTPQMNGDCNSCHTQNGSNGAPGRIVPPS